MGRTLPVAVALALAGCGDNLVPAEIHALVPDPAVITACAPGAVPAGGSRAKPVVCAEELIGGRLAAGRIGDVVLENDRVRVIIRGPGQGHYWAGSAGGGIVDAAAVGGDDLVKEIVPLVDKAGGSAALAVITEAGDDGPAEVAVRGPAVALDNMVQATGDGAPALVVETHYRLAPGATAVELETRVFASSGYLGAEADLADGFAMGGRVATFFPGQGFASTGSADLVASSGTTTSYGIAYPAGAAAPTLGGMANVKYVAGPKVTEAPVRRWLVIGDGSVASVTEAAWRLRGQPLGTITGATAPGVDVEVRDAAGEPLTIARATAAGDYRVAVPPGTYTLVARAAGRVDGAGVPATAIADRPTTVEVPAGAGGTLTVHVRDGAATPVPARLTLERGSERRLVWVGATGDATVALPPGSWRVAASRGLEYDAVIADPVTVTDGADAPLAITLERVVDTAGWISLDVHLHSELSPDSTIPVDDRVRAVAAEGIEAPVSTDHDFVFDYGPVVDELGLGAWLSPFTGEEATSPVWGHTNAFPLTVDPEATGNGAVHWLRRAPGAVFAALRGGDPRRIVQANHPRRPASLFDAIDLDPATLTARRDPTELGLPAGTDLGDLSFDTVEVASSKSHADFERVFADYLALVAAGHGAAATGSSDSHGAGAYAGEGRTYVWVGPGADDPATVDHDAILDGIRARHVVVGTCSFVTAGIVMGGGARSLPGDTVDVPAGAPIVLHVTVQAPPWQAVGALRVFQGTAELPAIALDPDATTPVRYDADLTLPAPEADTFYVVRVEPVGDGEPVNLTPMPSFTNPLFVHIAP